MKNMSFSWFPFWLPFMDMLRSIISDMVLYMIS